MSGGGAADVPPAPRFGAAGDASRAFRPGYPAELFERLLAAVPPPRRRAVDLGAGTGLSALPLCDAFEAVVAVEPDERMAAAMTAGPVPAQLVVVNVAAEAHGEAAGSVDLVTSGNAFYWMDGPTVAENAARWLRPAGVFAVWRYRFPRAPPPLQALLLEQLAGPWAPFVHPRLLDPEYSRRTLAEAPGLGGLEIAHVPNVVELDVATLVGFFRSTSFGAAHLAQLSAGDGRAHLAALEERLSAVAPATRFGVDFGLDLVVATRRP